MAISLLSNIPALKIRRNLEANTETYERGLERISSGRRINRVGDDAAGLAISESIKSRLHGVDRARLNTMEGLSLVQVAEGGMNEAGNIILRIKELAIQAASDTVGDKDRELLNIEASQLKSELERISETTKYLGTTLLNGSGRTFTFQIGPDNNEFNRIEYAASKVDIRPSSLNIDGVDISSVDSARDALEALDQAESKLAVPRAEVAAVQTRMHFISSHLANESETLTSAYSRIVDADMIKETTDVARAQIQQQAATAVMAQANSLPRIVLKLVEA